MKPISYPPRRERGVILFIALIVLVAMSLTGIAIIRSVDTAVMVAGNLAFRQVATAAAGRGVEQARAWIASIPADKLWADQPTGVIDNTGYFATAQTNLDLTNTDPNKLDFNWATSSITVTPVNGNAIQYVIHRMCDTVGDPSSQNCVRSTAASTGGGTPAGEVKYSTFSLPSVAQVLYRITTRVVGPRNTTTFIQVMAM